MKKTLSLLLALVFCLTTLSACADKPKETTAAPVETPSASTTPSESAPVVTEEPVIPFGLYKVTDNTGRTLGFKNNLPEYGATDYEDTCWTVESYENGDGTRSYVLFAGDLPRNALYTDSLIPNKAKLSVKWASATSPAVKNRFLMEENEDGTFTLTSCANKKMVLCAGEEAPTLRLAEENPADAAWKFEKLEGGCDRYKEWISDNNIITVRMGPDILKPETATDEMMQEWANIMEKTYYSYIELTGWAPYQHIIFKGYTPEEYPGYVMGDYMVISADIDFMYGDMKVRYQRAKRHNANDYNFLQLHEMGHMFDWDMQWNFEGETMTDIKLGYILYDNPGSVAAPSEFSSKEFYDASTINECLTKCAGGKMTAATKEYKIMRAAAIFVEFGQMDNWETMKKVYHWYTVGDGKDWKAKDNTEKLEKYIDLISEFSGKDIRSMIDPVEYEWLVKRTKED